LAGADQEARERPPLVGREAFLADLPCGGRWLKSREGARLQNDGRRSPKSLEWVDASSQSLAPASAQIGGADRARALVLARELGGSVRLARIPARVVIV
jgi:hypothetical protein